MTLVSVLITKIQMHGPSIPATDSDWAAQVADQLDYPAEAAASACCHQLSATDPRHCSAREQQPNVELYALDRPCRGSQYFILA